VDLLKVRLQTNYDGKSRMLNSALEVIRKDGVLALYDGLSASLLRQATYSTVRFGVYEGLKQRVMERTGQKNLSLAYTLPISFVAGALGGFAGNPADLLNVRMQADRKLPPEKRRNYKHAVDGLIRISRSEGVPALWTGVRPHVVRAMLMTASQLATYDSFKRGLLSTNVFSDNLFLHLLASTSSGIVATVVTAPVDIVKTRMMNAEPNKYRGAVDCAVRIARKEGLFGFYKVRLLVCSCLLRPALRAHCTCVCHVRLQGFIPAFVRLG
jgi:dicarboxylate transporter 10